MVAITFLCKAKVKRLVLEEFIWAILHDGVFWLVQLITIFMHWGRYRDFCKPGSSQCHVLFGCDFQSITWLNEWEYKEWMDEWMDGMNKSAECLGSLGEQCADSWTRGSSFPVQWGWNFSLSHIKANKHFGYQFPAFSCFTIWMFMVLLWWNIICLCKWVKFRIVRNCVCKSCLISLVRFVDMTELVWELCV